jgi:hypothetical protein
MIPGKSVQDLFKMYATKATWRTELRDLLPRLVEDNDHERDEPELIASSLINSTAAT